MFFCVSRRTAAVIKFFPHLLKKPDMAFVVADRGRRVSDLVLRKTALVQIKILKTGELFVKAT